MKFGFFRVSAATPSIKVADCVHNATTIINTIHSAAARHAGLVVFPELAVTGATCGDLFFQSALINEAERQLLRIASETRDLNIAAVVGLPLKIRGKLFNCAAIINAGRVAAVIPKVTADGDRYFARPDSANVFAPACGVELPFGPNMLVQFPSFMLGVEFGCDLFAAVPQSSRLAQSGASVIACLSADNEEPGKSAVRRDYVRLQSSRAKCAYIYANAGDGESTTDLVFSGHNIISENGEVLAEAARFKNETVYADVDLELLDFEQRKLANVPRDCLFAVAQVRDADFDVERVFPRNPFVPAGEAAQRESFEDALTLQAMGLKKRLEYLRLKNVVLGVSGGLDSTLALIAAVKTFEIMGLDKRGIYAITLPCFGTSGRTHGNAKTLADELGVTFHDISIKNAVSAHFQDIGHDPSVHDLTFENAQARERTQVLMDFASRVNGLMLGTGDLSELALGFATYNGDHMSMYSLDASIPKTLIRHLIKHYADNSSNEKLKAVLYDILNTPVSPELLPPELGDISQITENIVGPYELHDFFLYYMLRYGFEPDKILFMARKAFLGVYDDETVLRWLTVYYDRFFGAQYKRSCSPDGPKAGVLSFSPRGGFIMPSDAVKNVWVENLK